MPSARKATRGGVVIVGTVLIAISASAGTFDDRGRFDITDAAFGVSFDQPSQLLDQLDMSLYDMNSDPEQFTNLANDPVQNDRLANFRSQLGQ